MGGGLRYVVMVMVLVIVEESRMERQASKCGPRETCTPFRSCRFFQELLRRPTADIIRRIQQAICDSTRRNLKVCCHRPIGITLPSPITPKPVDRESLLPSSCQSRVARASFLPLQPIDTSFPIVPEVLFGENVTLEDPLAWMALLGYNSKTNPQWACGGSLISQQYVITAAHCVHSAHKNGMTLEVVRLGELNFKTAIDCSSNSFGGCAPAPQDFSPAEVIIHPEFNKRVSVSDDIALIRLGKRVTFNTYVKPLCLPSVGEDTKELVRGGWAEMAGWGLTEKGQNSQILQKATLPYVDKATCNPIFNNQLLPEQICFGGGKQDSCQGDSGGPVFVRHDYGIVLVGLVSHGLDFACGMENIPAVYTDVASYRSWVVSNLRP